MSDNQDKTFEHLLKAELRKESEQEASPCPDDNQMTAYLEKKLSPGQSALCESHLNSCPDCREQLSLLLRLEESLQAQAKAPAAETTIPVGVAAWKWFQRQGLKPAFALLIIAVVSVYWGIRVFEKSELEKESDRMKNINIAIRAPEPSALDIPGSSSLALKTTGNPNAEKAASKPTEREKAEPLAKSEKKAALAESGQPAAMESNAPTTRLSSPAAPVADASSQGKFSSSRMDARQNPPSDEIKKDGDREEVAPFSKPRSVSEVPRQAAVLVAGNESAAGSAPHTAPADSKEGGTKSIQTNQIPAGPAIPQKAEAKLRKGSEEQTRLSLDKEPQKQLSNSGISTLQKKKGGPSARRELQGKTFELRDQRWLDLSIQSGEMNSFETLIFDPGEATAIAPEFQPFLELLSEHTPLLIKLKGKIYLVKTH